VTVVSNGMLCMSDCMEIHEFIIREGRYKDGGRDNVAGVATCCGLAVREFESRWSEILRPV